MERSPWGRAFGGGDLRKWPMGCRMGEVRFVLGVHARMKRPGPDGVWGELGGRAAGNCQRCRRIGAFCFVRASVGSRGGHLGQQCAIEKKSGKGCLFFQGDLRF